MWSHFSWLNMCLFVVFIFFVFLLPKCQFANCSWACWQTSWWLPSFPFSPPSLVSLITWAEANSPALAAHHRHPLSLQRIRRWPVLTKPPNCTFSREHRFPACYIYLVSRTAEEMGVQPFMLFAERWLVCNAALQLGWWIKHCRCAGLTCKVCSLSAEILVAMKAMSKVHGKQQ